MQISALPVFKGQEYSAEEVEEMIKNGNAIDGRSGGLLSGPTHEQGGIPVIKDYRGIYKYEAEFEGYEYLLNCGASFVIKAHIAEINNRKRDEEGKFKAYHPPADTITLNTWNPIDTRLSAKFIIIESRGYIIIINKWSTLKKIEWLQKLNESITYRFENVFGKINPKLQAIAVETSEVLLELQL